MAEKDKSAEKKTFLHTITKVTPLDEMPIKYSIKLQLQRKQDGLDLVFINVLISNTLETVVLKLLY